MGLNVPKLFAITLGLSAATAALAGVFVGSLRFINPTFGADPLMKSLIVVILGGVARFTPLSSLALSRAFLLISLAFIGARLCCLP